MKIYGAIILVLVISQCRAKISDVLKKFSEEEISTDCKTALDIVTGNVSVLWRMFDASSKYPISGMSYGSNKDFGNFDQCIDINYESYDGNVKGKYCGLSVAVVNICLKPIPNPFSLKVKLKALAEIPEVTYIKDLKVARDLSVVYKDISLTMLSICIPDACTPTEVAKYFVLGDVELLNNTLVHIVDAVPCITKDSNTEFQTGDIIFIAFLSLILLLIVWSTAYDYLLQKLERKARHPLYLAFSLLTNGKKLLHVSNNNPGQIQCLNGLRFISMMWVIAGHGFVALESVPLLNYATLKDYSDQVGVQYVASAPIAVDTFFFLSGFLLTYGYLKSSVKVPPLKQVLGVPMMIVHRYLRLTPALAVLYFATITIYRKMGTGPLWDMVTKVMKEPCEKYWWSFFLYVQNYVNYGENEMCLTHTWYLSADMQMFLLAPLVLIPLSVLVKKDRTKLALICLCVLTAICVGFPMLIRFLDHTITNNYDTHSRLNDYLIGVILGVVLRQYTKFPFTKIVNLIIWCCVLVICISFNLYYHNIVRIYEHTKDTLFYGLYRPVWCSSLAWMVYSCYHGHGGPINWLLSLPAFQIGGRLSYCMYLLHAVVEMYWVGLFRTQFYWSDYTNFYIWCGHFIVTMLLSAVWSLCFESPMIVIEKFLFGNTKKKPSQKPEQ